MAAQPTINQPRIFIGWRTSKYTSKQDLHNPKYREAKLTQHLQ